MTERLFDTDAYLSEFDAVVTECFDTNGKYGIVLDRTAFFPEGGGQDADIGTIDGTDVVYVSDCNGKIVHFCERPFDVGKSVHGVLDFKERFRRMQNHTGEHILSGISNREYGTENVGFHLSEKYIRIDYDKYLSKEEVVELEALANRTVWENRSVKAYYPSTEELAEISYRSKKEIVGNLRLVVIEGTDVCACCAPHVANTGEVGCIKIVSCSKYKGGCRIEAVCGIDAYNLFASEHRMLSEMARDAGCKIEDVPSYLEKVKGDLRDFKHCLANVEKEMTAQKLDRIDKEDGNFCFFFENADTASLRDFLNGAVERTSGICATFSGNDTDGYRFIAASSAVNLKDKCKIFSEVLNAKCGGSEIMIQGTALTKRDDITSFFEKL